MGKWENTYIYSIDGFINQHIKVIDIWWYMGLQTNKLIDIPLNIPHYSIIYMAKKSRAPTAGGLPGKGKISARIASGDAWLVASSREKML